MRHNHNFPNNSADRAQYGTVITFVEGAPAGDIAGIIEYLRKNSVVSDVLPAEEFNPDHGSPIWYVP